MAKNILVTCCSGVLHVLVKWAVTREE